MNKFKIGEEVFIKKNLNDSLDDKHVEGPGSGYKNVKNFDIPLKIRGITDNTRCHPTHKGNIYWFENIKGGIFEFALELIPELDIIEVIDDQSECIKDLMNIFK